MFQRDFYPKHQKNGIILIRIDQNSYSYFFFGSRGYFLRNYVSLLTVFTIGGGAGRIYEDKNA